MGELNDEKITSQKKKVSTEAEEALSTKMNTKKGIEARLEAVCSKIEDWEKIFTSDGKLQGTIRDALDGTEQSKRLETILRLLIFIATTSLIFGIGTIGLLWGLAR